MLKFSTLLILLILLVQPLYSQNWHIHTIHDEISVSFPTEATKDEIEGKEMYISHIDGCAFILAISTNVIQNYDNYLLQDKNEKVKIINKFFDNFIRGKLAHNNKQLISIKTIKLGHYLGRQIKYSAVLPGSNQIRKRFSKMLLINNSLYSLECWYLDEQSHDKEREQFFNSLTIE